MKECRPIHFITPTVLTYLKVVCIYHILQVSTVCVKGPLAVQY